MSTCTAQPTHTDTRLAEALAAGRYALRRWEVNIERADEWHREAELAAHNGRYHAAADALLRQRVHADLANDFQHRYHRQLRLTRALVKRLQACQSNNGSAFERAGHRRAVTMAA